MKIDDKYKWLARDKNGKLFAFENKPKKMRILWSDEKMPEIRIQEIDERFSFIKWEDSEPIQITDIRNILALDSSDVINKPSHYHSNGIDVIGFAEAQFSNEEQKGFHRINAIKYITRYDRKNGIEDLNKAKFYIDKLIELEESKPLELDGNESDISTYYGGTNLGD